MFIGCSTVTGQYFAGSKFSSMAVAVLSTGGSVGGAMYPFLTQYLK